MYILIIRPLPRLLYIKYARVRADRHIHTSAPYIYDFDSSGDRLVSHSRAIRSGLLLLFFLSSLFRSGVFYKLEKRVCFREYIYTAHGEELSLQLFCSLVYSSKYIYPFWNFSPYRVTIVCRSRIYEFIA